MITTDDDGQARTVSGGTRKDRSVVQVEIQHRSTSDGASIERGSNGKSAAADTGGLSGPGQLVLKMELLFGETQEIGEQGCTDASGCWPDQRTVGPLLANCDPNSTEKVRHFRQKLSGILEIAADGIHSTSATTFDEAGCIYRPEVQVSGLPLPGVVG